MSAGLDARLSLRSPRPALSPPFSLVSTPMPPALFLLALYPFYFTLVLAALLAGVKHVLIATSSPTAVVRGLVC